MGDSINLQKVTVKHWVTLWEDGNPIGHKVVVRLPDTSPYEFIGEVTSNRKGVFFVSLRYGRQNEVGNVRIWNGKMSNRPVNNRWTSETVDKQYRLAFLEAVQIGLEWLFENDMEEVKLVTARLMSHANAREVVDQLLSPYSLGTVQ